MKATKHNGSLGSNIKVHFAGTDYDQRCITSLELAGVHYRLYTVFPAIIGKKPGDDFTDKSGVVKRQEKVFNHVIMDSGLFTLMFGGQKGVKQTKQTLLEWQDKTFEFVKQNKITGTCVDLDCQKLLGVEEAWFFRKRMKDALPNRQINVFHYEDGKKGLDRLIEFSDYIALSIPEIRIIHPKTFREDTYRLASYIKERKPEIDIHLLGCTDKKMLQQNRFCTTADSSSWTGTYRFATIQGKSTYDIKKSVYEEAEQRYKNAVERKVWESWTEKGRRLAVWELLSAEINKAVYTKFAGSQD